MKPHIGLNADFVSGKKPYNKLYLNYSRSVEAGGGVPVIIPNLTDDEDLLSMLSSLDALILTGGYDLDPALYHEKPHPATETLAPERQRADVKLAELALVMEMPVLGICLGCQLLNVVLGGTLIQDIKSETASEIAHTPETDDGKALHSVHVGPGTKLLGIVKSSVLEVDSSHHQAIKSLGRNLTVSARSEDEIVEAIELPGKWVLGVQWHPERQIDSPPHKALFQALVAAAGG